MILRLTAALLALAAGAGAVVLAALVLQRTPGPVSTASAQLPAASTPSTPAPGFPAPPAGAVVFSREDGPDVLALGLVPHGSNVLAQVSIVGQQGTGVNGRTVSIGSTRAVACGAGCYRATVPRSKAIDVEVGGTRWSVPLPSPWPPPDASAIVARATRVWRSLRSLAFSDHLGSDATHVVSSEWRTVAPNRVAYAIQGGYSAVIVGGTRWDRAPGGRWIASPQTPQLKQPVPVWQSATDAHVIREIGATLSITFYDPRTPAWFAITVDARTQRTFDLRMMTTAHFMHERYSSFDAPLSIVPPR
ncbi:MAG TPA: hypothetical protein VGN06_10775 [Gaiellaceae bacterium]